MIETIRIPIFFYIIPGLLFASLLDVRVLKTAVVRRTLKYDTPVALDDSGTRPRVLLGIASLNSTSEDGRLRRIIKHTYLDNFDSGILGDSDFEVCSLNSLKGKPRSEINDKCRLVYTFLLYEDYPLAHKKEPDAMFLPTRNNNTMIDWFRFAAEAMASKDYGSFHYVMFATNEITFLPGVFLDENIAMRKYDPLFLGGIPQNDTSCQIPADCLEEDFLALSSDNVRQFSENLKHLPTDVTLLSASRIGKLLNMAANQTSLLKGVRKQSSIAGEALRQWDKYVVEESAVSFVDEEEVKRVEASHSTVPSYNGGPRMLLGLFTWNATQKEIERRQAIRETYLNAYMDTDTPDRICSLQELLAKKVKETDCQLAYTFVFGMLNQEDVPMIRTNATSLDEMYAPDIRFPEPDALFLNIKENMNEGKSETWLHYGVLLQKVLHFDYIAKVDTDTLVFPSRFLPRLSSLPSFPKNARGYGGQDSIKPADVTNDSLGPSFMLGRFYWLSPDLARYVTTRCLHRDSFPEDKGIGNCLSHHPLPVQRMRLHRSCFEHSKALKNPEVMRRWWRSHTNSLRINSQ